MPDNNVTGVLQTPDGYLWVGTHGGLARFDGVRFQHQPLPILPGHAHPLIRAIASGRNNSIWMALETEGGTVVNLSAQATNVFTTGSGLPSFKPIVMVGDSNGAMWIAYVDGSACRISNSKVTRFTASDGLHGTGGCWLTADINGQLWFAKAGRDVA